MAASALRLRPSFATSAAATAVSSLGGCSTRRRGRRRASRPLSAWPSAAPSGAASLSPFSGIGSAAPRRPPALPRPRPPPPLPWPKPPPWLVRGLASRLVEALPLSSVPSRRLPQARSLPRECVRVGGEGMVVLGLPCLVVCPVLVVVCKRGEGVAVDTASRSAVLLARAGRDVQRRLAVAVPAVDVAGVRLERAHVVPTRGLPPGGGRRRLRHRFLQYLSSSHHTQKNTVSRGH